MIVFLALFFISGFCSLIYEIVWLRLAMGAFGVTAPFVSIFLSVFMAGLGLGSWGGGALSRRLKSKASPYFLRLYAGAELIISLSALAVPFLLDRSRALLAGMAWDSSGYYWASGLCTATALLPWCVCMGATFPLAMAAIENRFQARSQDSFSYLYVANLIGAAAGTGISAFVLIELLGFRATLYAAAALNLLAAAGAAALSYSRVMTLSEAPAKGEARASHQNPAAPPNSLLLLFALGLTSMAMEVAWARQFAPYLDNSVYAFALVLGTYLLGSFAGLCLYRAAVKKKIASIDAAWIISGALSLLPLYAADPYLPLHGSLRIALGVMPFCCILGVLTPSLIDGWSSGDPHRAGQAYAVNVLGCILGPLLAGFLLLPRMSERAVLVALSLPLFIAGYAAARRRGWALYALSISFAGLLAAVSSTFETRAALMDSKIQIRRDYQATVIAGGRASKRCLIVNEIGMTKLTPITKIMAHLPLAFLSRRPQKALVVCFGMGTTFRSLLSWGIESKAVELVPSVPLLFGFFHDDADKIMALPNAEVIIDDGRRFLARSAESFDVITMDPAPPMSALATSFLYSEEYYAAVKNRLTPDGIMQQWIIEPLEPVVLSAIAKAIKNSFPYVRVFRSLEGWGYHCLASRKPLPQDTASALLARMPAAAVKDLVELGPHRSGLKQLQAILKSELPIDRLILPGAQGLSDDRPINEYFFLRAHLF